VKAALLPLCLFAACSTVPVGEQAWPTNSYDIASPSYSDEVGAGGGGESTEESEEEEPLNLIAIFTGYTTERGEGGGTLGIEYERRINSWLGVGILGEVVFGSHPASVFAAGVYLRPTEDLAVVVMPGVEFEDEEDGRFLMRLGLNYHLWRSGSFGVVPGVYADFFRGSTAFVAGLNFVWEF